AVVAEGFLARDAACQTTVNPEHRYPTRGRGLDQVGVAFDGRSDFEHLLQIALTDLFGLPAVVKRYPGIIVEGPPLTPIYQPDAVIVRRLEELSVVLTRRALLHPRGLRCASRHPEGNDHEGKEPTVHCPPPAADLICRAV